MKKIASCVIFALMIQSVCSMERATAPVKEKNSTFRKVAISTGIIGGAAALAKYAFHASNRTTIGIGAAATAVTAMGSVLFSYFGSEKKQDGVITKPEDVKEDVQLVDDHASPVGVDEGDRNQSMESMQSSLSFSSHMSTHSMGGTDSIPYRTALQILVDRYMVLSDDLQEIRFKDFFLNVVSSVDESNPGFAYFSRSGLFFIGSFSPDSLRPSLHFNSTNMLDIVTMIEAAPVKYSFSGIDSCLLDLNEIAKLRKLVVSNNGKTVWLLQDDQKLAFALDDFSESGRTIYFGNFCYEGQRPIFHGKGTLWTERNGCFEGFFENGVFVNDKPVTVRRVARKRRQPR